MQLVPRAVMNHTHFTMRSMIGETCLSSSNFSQSPPEFQISRIELAKWLFKYETRIAAIGSLRTFDMLANMAVVLHAT